MPNEVGFAAWSAATVAAQSAVIGSSIATAESSIAVVG